MRVAFCCVHFGIGFFLLWLSHLYAELSLLTDAPALWAKGLVETAYLVAGVVWGNLGWEIAINRINSETGLSEVIFFASRTIAPVAVALPFILNGIDFAARGPELWWVSAKVLPNVFLACVAAAVCLILLIYRRSERSVFYRAHEQRRTAYT